MIGDTRSPKPLPDFKEEERAKIKSRFFWTSEKLHKSEVWKIVDLSSVVAIELISDSNSGSFILIRTTGSDIGLPEIGTAYEQERGFGVFTDLRDAWIDFKINNNGI